MKAIQHIVNVYNQDGIDFVDARQAIIDLIASNEFYYNYLGNCVHTKSDIRTNEFLIHVETSLSVYESKNRKTMVRTGLSYARYPKWRISSCKIEEMATVALTDRSIYIIGINGVMIYPYNKIVNIGYENGHAYFDVKTSSSYPHRFKIKSTENKDLLKPQNITLFLNLLCDWNNSQCIRPHPLCLH
ncbi:MAG: hypothetical protein IKU60_02065 [Clostridia bacterium]|nr:hypothetical protein [Clostridia bacterium]